jgi:hypothetical protein
LGKFRGITLLEVLYKLWEMIVYRRAVALIQFHPDLHGFRHQRGTGTAILEAKLEMQWAASQGVPYYQIFLDLVKAYDAVDRDRLIDILAGYGFGPNILRFLSRVWADAQVVLRQMGYYGPLINSRCGIWQGSILSPLFLNILVDAVLRLWHRKIDTNVIGTFYADDGRLAMRSPPEVLQRAFDVLLELFERTGLVAHTAKTKAMVCMGRPRHHIMSAAAYK